MKDCHKVLGAISLLIWILWLPVQIYAQATANYAFLHVPADGIPEITFLEVSTELISPRETTQLPNSEGTLVDALMSPRKDWIALFYASTPEGGGLQLFNVTNGENRDLIHGLFAVNSTRRSQQSQVAAWSPDGKYLAFDILTDNGIELYLYTVAENKLAQIAETLLHYSRTTWSADSSIFAFERSNCADDGRCVFSIELVDPANLSTVRNLDVSGLFLGNSVAASTVCSLSLSPNAQYLSFVSICDSSAFEARKEVFYLDIQTGNLTQLTNYTEQARQTEGAISLIGQYSTFWLDDTTLLVGAIIGSNQGLVTETVTFTLPNTDPTLLIEAAAEEWAYISPTNEIFFRAVDNVSTETFLPESNGVFKLDSTQKVAILVDSQDVAVGCNLVISHDEKYLSYTRHESKRCRDRISALVIIEPTSGNTLEYDLSTILKSESDLILPLGWVQVAAQ